MFALREFGGRPSPGLTVLPPNWYEGAGIGDKRCLHKDERGSVVAITSESGSVLAVNSYDEYGIPASTNIGRFQYTGQAWLADLGLYYYKARVYSPTLGRFLQTDPIGYDDGMNIYAYVGGDPVNYTDPTGLCRIETWGRVRRTYQGDKLRNVEILNRWTVKKGCDQADLAQFGSNGNAPQLGNGGGSGRGKPQSDHDYSLERDLRCSAANGFEALKDSGAAPFADPIPDGTITRDTTILFGQRITQRIDSGSRSVTNVMSPGHYFRHGTVTLSITSTGANSSRLTIRGVGTNVSQFRAVLNQLSGPVIFSEVASDIQRKCSIRG